MAKSKVDNRDNREIVVEELQKYSNGYMKTAGQWLMVRCPFHDDKTPSCGVIVSLDNPEKLGFFNCLGCAEKGPWNKFAKQAGLQEIKEWKNKQLGQSADFINGDLEESLLGSESLTTKGVLKRLGVPEAQPWPVTMDWRGFPGNIVKRAGGYIAMDNYSDSIQLVFIIKYAGQVRGGVKAVYERTRKGQPGYINMRGPWANKYGLLFLEQARSILDRNNYKFIILVEGPRDALRLLCNGIPAVAVLGAATMTKSKALMLTSLGATDIYVIPDNDKGGKTFWVTAKKALLDFIPPTRIRLPKTNEKGKEVKIDPGNMPLYLLEDLIEFLQDKHNFNRRKTLI
jgi:hypothetical protein